PLNIDKSLYKISFFNPHGFLRALPFPKIIKCFVSSSIKVKFLKSKSSSLIQPRTPCTELGFSLNKKYFSLLTLADFFIKYVFNNFSVSTLHLSVKSRLL